MDSIKKCFYYLKDYSTRVVLNIFVTIIVAILEVVSLLSIIPFLKIIFGKDDIQFQEQPSPFRLFPLDEAGSLLKEHFNYIMYSLSTEYSKKEVLTFICLAVVISFLLKNIFLYINKMIDKSIRYNVAKDLRQKVYNKALRLPIRFFSEQKRADILTRFSNDILKIEVSVLNGFSLLFKEPIMILFYLVSMLIISTKLTLFILILIPVLGFIVGKISKSLKRQSGAYQRKFEALLSMLDETMFGAKVIKSFTAEKYLQDKFTEENYKLKQIHKKIHLRRMSASPVSEVIGVAIVMVVLWYGGNLILNESSSALSGEMLIGYLIIFSRMISPIKALSDLYSTLQDGMASSDRVDHYLAFEEEYSQLPEKTGSVREFKESIDFDNVSFHYPSTNKLVLEQLNLTIPKGNVVALVGQSGAGKSTIADLLPRFYEVSDGAILIDGVDSRNIPLQELRSMFSYVSQEAILFNDSVKNNITFGIPDKSDEEIMTAAKVANAHEFITQLEQGYDSNVGERGSKLSGGQKQRITIARAILKNAPILILDEATSALDTESERLVQDAVNKLLENRTALVIAHRLSTIKNADQICVMEDGKIIERGTHEELITKQSGQYKSLTEMQAL